MADEKRRKKKKRKKKQRKPGQGIGSYIILGTIFLIGLGVLLYPSVSDFYNSFHQSRAIMNYASMIADMNEEEYERALTSASEYNQKLLTRSNGFELPEEDKALYESTLNLDGNGVMGYIEIPSISVSLPIYHYADEAVLQTAIGHLEWSSLPIGGESTHCVLSGHRGLPTARLFTDLDRLVVGDTFTLNVLNEVYTYEVDQILIVLPEDMGALQISQGEDYCTLVTCTPYGINTHRILCRGHRIDNATDVRITSEAVQIEKQIVAPFLGVPMAIIAFYFLGRADRARRSDLEVMY